MTAAITSDLPVIQAQSLRSAGEPPCYSFTMRSRASQIIVALVLLTCLVCPFVEMFDNWDHTAQTGNDTEYALVVLALCVGVVYTLARLIVTLSPGLSSISVGPNSPRLQGSLLSLIYPIVLDSAISSPRLSLRI